MNFFKTNKTLRAENNSLKLDIQALKGRLEEREDDYFKSLDYIKGYEKKIGRLEAEKQTLNSMLQIHNKKYAELLKTLKGGRK